MANKPRLLLPLLVLFLTLPLEAVSLSQSDCSVLMNIDHTHSNCAIPTHDLTGPLNCSSLQEALDSISPASFSADQSQPVCLSLSSGEHELSYNSTDIDYNVTIVGAGVDETVVSCSPDASYDSNRYVEFPLKFGRDINVVLEGISFTDCRRPLLFGGSASVTIQHCQFSLFTQTATEIYATPLVTLTNCTFTNNTSYGEGTIRSSGNAGAVSIGYNDTYQSATPPLIQIENCTFLNNSARVKGVCGSTTSALFSKIYVQRGGAIGCYFSAAGLQSMVHITDSWFEGNVAEDSGGAIYINMNGNGTATTNITVTGSSFIENMAQHGGGLEFTFDTPNSVEYPNFVAVRDCLFQGNNGSQGGAIKFPQISQGGNLNFIRLTHSQFVNNTAQTGAAAHMETFLTGQLINPVMDTIQIHVHSCLFQGNEGKRGVIFLSFNHAVFSGSSSFVENIGPSLRLFGCLASLKGVMVHRDNRNHHEGLSGMLHISSFAQVLLNPNVSLSFINNTGIEGAAIVVKTPRISNAFAKTLYNPQCFLQFSEPQTPPLSWIDQNVSMEFHGNTAQVGPVLFITSLNACSWFNFSGSYFNLDIRETWTFLTIGENHIIRRGERLNDSDLYIQTHLDRLLPLGDQSPAIQCQGGEGDVCAYPGQNISLNVSAVGQFNHSTSGFLQISQDKPPGTTQVDFTPSIVQVSPNIEDIHFKYTYISSGNHSPIQVNLRASFSPTEVSTSFTLQPISCPPGYRLSEDSQQCECRDSAEVLACDSDMQFILLEDGLWGAPPNWSRSLVTYPCPPGYCDCSDNPYGDTVEGCTLWFNDSSRSCSEHRHGDILCGKCDSQYGVGMLSMECRRFTSVNMYYWLMPMLVIFVVVAVVIIVKVGVVIPSFFLGYLFYIQVSPVAVAFFSQPFNLNTTAMSSIGSLLSLYVPYDFSLHHELKALESYGLRYIPPILALATVPVATAIKFHPRSWNGIWTLLLLMYGMTVDTSTSLVFCPPFKGSPNGTSERVTVWFYDGSVRCFQDGHLGLVFVALLFLLTAVLLVPAIAIIVYQKELSSKLAFLDRRSLEKLSLSLCSPYHHHTRWWLPLELARRLIFIMSAVLCPGYVSLSLLEAGALLTLSWFVQPYKDWKANAAEAFSITVLTLLLILGNNKSLVDLGRERSNVILWPLFYLPLVVAAVSVGGYCAWKLWMWTPVTRLRGWYRQRRRGEGEEGLGKTRRATVLDVFKRRSIKTTEVTLDDTVELTKM